MKKWLTLMLGCAQLVASPSQLVHDTCEEFYQDNDFPGLAAGFYYKGNIYFFNFGTANDRKETPISEETLFELGSISKLFTSTLLALEVKGGRMKLVDTLSKHLAYLREHPSNLNALTLEQLATHTSSLPRESTVPRNDRDPDTVMRALEEWEPEYPPGSHYFYSNLGFFLLRCVINESVYPSNYIEYTEEKLFDPLGMHRTYYCVPPSERKRGNHILNTCNVEPSGPAASCSADMMQFLKANLGVEGSEELQAAMEFAQRGFFRVGPNFVQGLGWERNPRGEIVIIDKNGGTATHSTWIGMIPELEIGLFFLGNKNVKGMTKVGRDLLEIIALEHTTP